MYLTGAEKNLVVSEFWHRFCPLISEMSHVTRCWGLRKSNRMYFPFSFTKQWCWKIHWKWHHICGPYLLVENCATSSIPSKCDILYERLLMSLSYSEQSLAARQQGLQLMLVYITFVFRARCTEESSNECLPLASLALLSYRLWAIERNRGVKGS